MFAGAGSVVSVVVVSTEPISEGLSCRSSWPVEELELFVMVFEEELLVLFSPSSPVSIDWVVLVSEEKFSVKLVAFEFTKSTEISDSEEEGVDETSFTTNRL